MKLTEDKFNKTVDKIVISERSKEMAYEILVRGISSEIVGNSLSVSRQTAHKSATRVWKKYLESINCPEGWTTIELIIPPEYKNKFKEIQQEILNKYAVD
jgi:hypothetical protein